MSSISDIIGNLQQADSLAGTLMERISAEKGQIKQSQDMIWSTFSGDRAAMGAITTFDTMLHYLENAEASLLNCKNGIRELANSLLK